MTGVLAICFQRRTAGAGVLGASGIPLAMFAIGPSPTADPGEATLAIALALLVLGVARYVLGEAVGRLPEERPEDEA